jgi:hypothetical protein
VPTAARSVRRKQSWKSKRFQVVLSNEFLQTALEIEMRPPCRSALKFLRARFRWDMLLAVDLRLFDGERIGEPVKEK